MWLDTWVVALESDWIELCVVRDGVTTGVLALVCFDLDLPSGFLVCWLEVIFSLF
jgi:hypothetical protein